MYFHISLNMEAALHHFIIFIDMFCLRNIDEVCSFRNFAKYEYFRKSALEVYIRSPLSALRYQFSKCLIVISFYNLNWNNYLSESTTDFTLQDFILRDWKKRDHSGRHCWKTFHDISKNKFYRTIIVYRHLIITRREDPNFH